MIFLYLYAHTAIIIFLCVSSFSVCLVLIMGSFYAVHIGRKQGVFNSWGECESIVKGFKGAKYKKFTTLEAAQQFAKYGFGANNSKTEETPSTNKCRKRKFALSTEGSCKRAKSSDTEENLKVVYTDGACSGNGKRNCKAGYGVWWGLNHPLNLSCKLKGIQTNQRAEIAAVNACIKQARENKLEKILIRTDSMFVINCVNKWIPGWRSRNWIKADGKPVIHKVEFETMLENMEHVKVSFQHVYGHSGEFGNEMADRLAVEAISNSAL